MKHEDLPKPEQIHNDIQIYGSYWKTSNIGIICSKPIYCES